MPTTTVRMTHPERAARRKEIAEYVRANHSRQEAVVKFGVSIDSVDQACREHGVKPTRYQHRQPKSFEIVAVLQNTSKTIVEIADERGVEHQWVRELYHAALEGGIKFPNRNAKGKPLK